MNSIQATGGPIMWNPKNSWLYSVNPLTKAYLLMFVVTFVSFFSGVKIVIVLSAALLVLLFTSGIELRAFLDIAGKFLILLIAFSFGLAWVEFGTTMKALNAGLITYGRFFNIVLAGGIFLFTTNPSDISLFFFKYKTARPIGITIASALSSVLMMRRSISNTISLQRLRGVRFSVFPPKIKQNLTAIESLLIPSILQSIDLSFHYSDALIARGYNKERDIHLPPRLRFDYLDYGLILVGTILMAGIFIFETSTL